MWPVPCESRGGWHSGESVGPGVRRSGLQTGLCSQRAWALGKSFGFFSLPLVSFSSFVKGALLTNLLRHYGADVTGAFSPAGRRVKGESSLRSLVGFPLHTSNGLLENCFRVSKELSLSYKKRKSRLLSKV